MVLILPTLFTCYTINKSVIETRIGHQQNIEIGKYKEEIAVLQKLFTVKTLSPILTTYVHMSVKMKLHPGNERAITWIPKHISMCS
jgi:hypothetical protein